jgi:hypothetical protein
MRCPLVRFEGRLVVEHLIEEELGGLRARLVDEKYANPASF